MVTFIIIFFLTSPLLYAFTLNNSGEASFFHNDIRISVADHVILGECPSIADTPQDILGYVKKSIHMYWNRVPTSSLYLKAGTVLNLSSDFQTEPLCTIGTSCIPNPLLIVNQDILISCNTNLQNFPSSNQKGLAIPNNFTDKNIKGSLILLNGNTNGFGILREEDKISVIAHELGHALGLGHSPVKDSLMYFSTVPKRRSLGEDDIDGITYLYPAQQPFGCGTLSDSHEIPPSFLHFILISFLGIILLKLKGLSNKLFKFFSTFLIIFKLIIRGKSWGKE
jgi:hypothetical protein